METQRGESQEQPAENEPEEPGAEGGADSEDADRLPGARTQTDVSVGDTDQHSGG
jgi:hypothetical protein